MMTHGLLWEPQMTCQSSQTGSVSVQTDLALPIHYSECLAKPGSAPLLITAGRHIRLTPSSVDTHALVHTQRIHAFHCVHTHRAVAFIILFVQPLFVTITTYTMIAKNYQKKNSFFGMYTIVVPSFVAFKKVPQQTTYIVQKICKYVSTNDSCFVQFHALVHSEMCQITINHAIQGIAHFGHFGLLQSVLSNFSHEILQLQTNQSHGIYGSGDVLKHNNNMSV